MKIQITGQKERMIIMLNVFLFTTIILYLFGAQFTGKSGIKKKIISKKAFIVVVIISIFICILQIVINSQLLNHLHNENLKETYIVDNNLIENSYIINNTYYFPTKNNVEKINLIQYNRIYVDSKGDTGISKVEQYEKTFNNKLLYLFFDSVDIVKIYQQPMS